MQNKNRRKLSVLALINFDNTGGVVLAPSRGFRALKHFARCGHHLQFDIDNRAIVTSLPLGLPEVVFGPSDELVGEAMLSPDGNELYFSGSEMGDPAGNYGIISVIDLENCAELPCPATRILTNEKGGVSSLSRSPDGSRLYFENADADRDPEVHRVSFIEKRRPTTMARGKAPRM